MTKQNVTHQEEIILKAKQGMPILILAVLLFLGSIVLFVAPVVGNASTTWVALGVILGCMAILAGLLLCMGLKVLKRNEAYVLTLFGTYYGTLKGEGFFFVHPFVSAVTPNEGNATSGAVSNETVAPAVKAGNPAQSQSGSNRKISLKTMTLNNEKQKINDQMGNPIIIGIVVIWRVVNTAKAVFNVDNYTEFLSIQCDSALRNIVRLYPYDISGGDEDSNERSLRGSSQEIAEKLKAEIQSKVEVAGLEIMEARITHLAYAPEIAAAMLQRQQASAVIDARQMIVDGAVGMVEMALSRLSEHNVVELDEERKAAMVSNLLVVLCGNRDAQPIVNSGSLY